VIVAVNRIIITLQRPRHVLFHHELACDSRLIISTLERKMLSVMERCECEFDLLRGNAEVTRPEREEERKVQGSKEFFWSRTKRIERPCFVCCTN
jgi:hypothetical protein